MPISHITVFSFEEPVVQVVNENKRELVYNLRIEGENFSSYILEEGNYSIQYGSGAKGEWTCLDNLELYEKPGRIPWLFNKIYLWYRR